MATQLQPARPFRLGIHIQLIVTTLLIVVPVLSISSYFYYQNGARALRGEIRSRLIAAAAITARMIPQEDIARIQTPQDEWGDSYRRVKHHLMAVRDRVEGVRYASILVPIAPPLKWRYLLDSDIEPDDLNNNGIIEPELEGLTHVGDPTSNYDLAQFPVMRQALDKPTADQDFITDQWGTWLSGYAPIQDASGKTVAMVAIDLMDDQVRQEESIMQTIAWTVLAVGLALTLLLTSLLARIMTRPIHRLAHAASVVADGDLTITVPLDRNDELGDLTKAFNRMTQKLVDNQKMLVEGERQRSEMNIAARIQTAMLPQEPPQINQLQIAASLRPATEVAGDYYDFLTFDDATLGVIVADVNGHGLPSAILMAMLRACVHTHMFQRSPDETPSPIPLLEVANRMVHGAGSERRFATAVTALFNHQTGDMHYASAGHLPPYVWKAQTQEVVELPVAKAYPLGVRPQARLKANNYPLEPGDLVVFYSDGLTEARSPVGEEWGFDRLQAFMKEHAALSADLFHQKLLLTWEEWLGGLPPEDDLTLVVVKRT